MNKRKDKVVKTYGRHKNRVIKTDVWDSEFNCSRQNIFSLSASFDDDDFVEPKLLKHKNVTKRKKNDEDKENNITKRGKSTTRRKKKKKVEHNLFAEKETVDSFSEGSDGRPLKDLPPKMVPGSVRKNGAGNRTKLYFEESQLQIESKEKSLSINFSDFDNYNLCISDSPVQAAPKASNDSSSLGKEISPEIFSRMTEPAQLTKSDKNSESRGEKDTNSRKPQQNTRMATSTPLATVTTVSRLQDTQNRTIDDHSLFEETRNDRYQDSKSDLSNLKEQDNSIRYSPPLKMDLSWLPREAVSPTKNNSIDLSEHSIKDCFVQMMKLEQEIENSLNMDNHLEQIVPLRSKKQKNGSGKQSSIENNNDDDKNNCNSDVTENNESRRMSLCANCSFDQPCGERCVYMDCKLSPDTCSVQLRKLEDLISDLSKPENSKDSNLGSVNFDASRNLFESYFNTSHISPDVEHSDDEDEHRDRVPGVIEDREDLAVEKLGQILSTTLLSDVVEEDDEEEEEESEGELVSSISGGEVTDEEEVAEDRHPLAESFGPHDYENSKETIEEVDMRPPLPKHSPYLTRNYTSSLCTETDSVCTNVTQNSLYHGSFIRSPYMTRHSKLLGVSTDESKVESLPSTPKQDGFGCHGYKDHAQGDDNQSSQVSPVMNVSSPSRSFIELLSPKVSCLSPRSKILEQCEQDDFVSFSDRINYTMMKNCVKIGEGVYGEVFRTKRKGQSVALKIIPIEGDFEVNECPQKDFVEILPEIVISRELSDLRNGTEDKTENFVFVNSVSCLKGSYPYQLMREWDIFHKQKRSDNDRPDIFDNNQLFILFEFGDGGSALEQFKMNNLRQAKSVLQQVTYGLAIAESALEFEHRDLHWGNVLVRPCPKDNLHYTLKGTDIYLPSWGLEVSIIDFTLSRLRKDGCTVFCDLAKDEALFEGTGDYQFDVYRLMRAQTENEWERHRPKTNVYWIHYLADKLLKCKKYEEYTREDNEILRSLRQFVREVTDYTSTVDLVTTCPFIMASPV